MFFRRKPGGGGTVKLPVFGNGFLDTIDDVFWMLPFSSVRQAQLVCQDRNITVDDWTERRERLVQEHRRDAARKQLWKAWVASEHFQKTKAAAEESATAEAEIPEYDD